MRVPTGGSWFERGRHRQLSAVEQGFLFALIEMMRDLSPAQVDPSQTALTNEGGSVLICLIPHRCLGGLTIDVSLMTSLSMSKGVKSVLKGVGPLPRPRVSITVSWAYLFNLSCHDDLDMGHFIGSHEIGDVSAPDFGPALHSVREQLTRPLTLRIWKGTGDSPLYAECHLGNGPRIARIGKRPWRAAKSKEEVVVRFIDTAPPPFTYPSYAPLWFESEAAAKARLRELDGG